ncbi:preATP grasp domain-containing protein [Nocardiopsis nanhaiensis]
MPKIIIVNVPEEMVGDLEKLNLDKRKAFGAGAQRILWYTEPGDIIVLPYPPTQEFMEYVTALTGVDPASLTIVIPAPGRFGPHILTADRILAPDFHRDLGKVLTDRPVDRLLCTYNDSSITGLASVLHIEDALSGFAFSDQGGDALINSKAVFRAVAAGNGIPIAPGVITNQPARAEHAIAELLDQGFPVMVKQEFAGGGLGNEVLSRSEDVRPSGARNVRLLPDRASVRRYLEERWSWLTGHKGHNLVIERFFPDSLTVYAEFDSTEEGCVFRGSGEILMEPTAVGEIIPPQSIGPEEQSELVAMAERACKPFHGMGYRGTLCADAVRTPSGELFFTEVNGRLTASSHLHVNLVDRVVGREHRDSRVFLERAAGWSVSSFDEALRLLERSGAAYDPRSRKGVVVTADYTSTLGKVTYCAISENLDGVRRLEELVQESTTAPGGANQ